VALIVSGGHTMLVLMKNLHSYKVLGQTVDDAAGEAFDKVAKLLKLPYPGGPEVSKLAEQGQPDFEFPRPMINSKDYNFSFSGLKTAVLYFLRDHPQTPKADICKAFEDAAVDVLITKTLRAAKQYKAKSVSLSGGVSANKKLRQDLQNICKQNNLACFIPERHLSTDNAEMIAIAAAVQLSRGNKPIPAGKIKANPNLSL
jgi:N6-L-threonylcarbamoyladenine synthase